METFNNSKNTLSLTVVCSVAIYHRTHVCLCLRNFAMKSGGTCNHCRVHVSFNKYRGHKAMYSSGLDLCVSKVLGKNRQMDALVSEMHPLGSFSGPGLARVSLIWNSDRKPSFFWSEEWSEFIGKGLIQLFWFDNNSITQKTIKQQTT